MYVVFYICRRFGINLESIDSFFARFPPRFALNVCEKKLAIPCIPWHNKRPAANMCVRMWCKKYRKYNIAGNMWRSYRGLDVFPLVASSPGTNNVRWTPLILTTPGIICLFLWTKTIPGSLVCLVATYFLASSRVQHVEQDTFLLQ